MKKSARFVVRAVAGKGWRIWNRRASGKGNWWGNYFRIFPSDLINELNGEHRPEKIVEFTKKYEKL